MNIKKQKPQDLIDFTKQETVVVESEYANVDEQDNLDRFDNTFKKNKKKRKPARPKGENQNANPNARGKKVENAAKEDIKSADSPKPVQKKAKPRPKAKPKVVGEEAKTVNPAVSAAKEGEAGIPAPKKNKRRRPPRKDGPKNEDKPKTNE